MNIKRIREIVDLPFGDEYKENLILKELSNDSKAVTYILTVLDFQRKENEELIIDLNVEVGRLDILSDNSKLGGSNKKERENFRRKNVDSLYKKWKHRISHGFKNNYKP